MRETSGQLDACGRSAFWFKKGEKLGYGARVVEGMKCHSFYLVSVSIWPAHRRHESEEIGIFAKEPHQTAVEVE